jgi:hypothetical protein|tara:strand:- start:167 stop:430 length:264 start_codon:yes stop_codon:yes gene_type:complete
MLAVNTYMFKVGDLVRRHQVGEPEQMFMFDARNLGVVVQVHDHEGSLTLPYNAPGIHVYWQLSERATYYSTYSAEKVLELIAKADHD